MQHGQPRSAGSSVVSVSRRGESSESSVHRACLAFRFALFVAPAPHRHPQHSPGHSMHAGVPARQRGSMMRRQPDKAAPGTERRLAGQATSSPKGKRRTRNWASKASHTCRAAATWRRAQARRPGMCTCDGDVQSESWERQRGRRDARLRGGAGALRRGPLKHEHRQEPLSSSPGSYV